MVQTQVQGQSQAAAECASCRQLEAEFAKNPSPGGSALKRKGLLLLAISGGAAVGLTAISLPFVVPAFRRICLPYVPATTAQVHNVLKALQTGHQPGQAVSLIDIGSGDGRIVIEAAKAGFRSYGVELNPWLVMYSKWRAFRLGLGSKATFYRQDLWTINFGLYDSVVIFGVDEMMTDLGKKMEAEVKPGCRIVACRFPFPHWQPSSTIGQGLDTVWLYTGVWQHRSAN